MVNIKNKFRIEVTNEMEPNKKDWFTYPFDEQLIINQLDLLNTNWAFISNQELPFRTNVNTPINDINGLCHSYLYLNDNVKLHKDELKKYFFKDQFIDLLGNVDKISFFSNLTKLESIEKICNKRQLDDYLYPKFSRNNLMKSKKFLEVDNGTFYYSKG